MKRIFTDDNLPAHLKADLAALLASLSTKYGNAAVRLGTHIENLATVCAMVGNATFTPTERAEAENNAKEICKAIIMDLGSAFRVDPKSAFAVAHALRDYCQQAGDEILGEQPVSATVADEAARALARAAAN